MAERPDLAGRVAWTYLATVLAGAAGGLVALVAYQFVNPLLCTPAGEEAADQALTCSLVSGMGLLVAGFAAAFAGMLAVLKLDRRLAAWLALVAGLLGLLVGVDAIGQWWWVLAAVLLPTAAAVASADWSPRPQFRRGQVAVLAGLVVAGLVAFVWQLVAG